MSTAKPDIVSPEQWRAAREALLVKEKAHTRARDALAAERRRMPMIRVEKDYRFTAPGGGDATLLDLVDGSRQLARSSLLRRAHQACLRASRKSSIRRPEWTTFESRNRSRAHGCFRPGGRAAPHADDPRGE